MRLYRGKLPDKNHRSLGMTVKKGLGCRQRNGGAKITPHRIDSYADHKKTRAIKDSGVKKRKARIKIAGLRVCVAKA